MLGYPTGINTMWKQMTIEEQELIEHLVQIDCFYAAGVLAGGEASPLAQALEWLEWFSNEEDMPF